MLTKSILYSTPKEERSFYLFWLGFILYTLCFASPWTSHIIIIICQVIQFASLILMVSTSFGFFQFKLNNPYLKTLFTLYAIWLFVTIIRGYVAFNFVYIKNFLFNPTNGILYFSPFLLFFPRKLIFYKKLFNVIIILGIFYILFDILFIGDLLNSDDSNEKSKAIVEMLSALSFSCGFILLTLFYHSARRQILAAGVIFLALFFAVVRARRGLILMYADIILFSYIIYIFQSKSKLLILYLTVVITLAGAIYASGVYKPLNNRVYGFLFSRGEEDTRSGVELYFYDDMKTKDWIIGRGINGEYYCPDIEEDQVTDYRQTIETGYLQTILNGGTISLGLFLLMAVPAMLKGIFSSKNILSKAAGVWILMSIINSYPATVTKFELSYLLVWISIGICYNKEIRNMPESQMRLSLMN